MYVFIYFSDIEEEPQSDVSSAVSTATPSTSSYPGGNRFFGPDFNIETLRDQIRSEYFLLLRSSEV
jgi:hypothetical protein